MIYVHATIKLRAGKLGEFMQVLGDMVPAIAKHGWKLAGCYATMAGRMNSVVDIWELPDMSAFEAAMADQELAARFGGRLAAVIEEENVSILAKLPIG